MVSDSLLSIAL